MFCKGANLKKEATVHPLRHSFYTLTGGEEAGYIQKLQKHKSSKTIEIYTDVNNKDIERTKSLLDGLQIKGGEDEFGYTALPVIY